MMCDVYLIGFVMSKFHFIGSMYRLTSWRLYDETRF